MQSAWESDFVVPIITAVGILVLTFAYGLSKFLSFEKQKKGGDRGVSESQRKDQQSEQGLFLNSRFFGAMLASTGFFVMLVLSLPFGVRFGSEKEIESGALFLLAVFLALILSVYLTKNRDQSWRSIFTSQIFSERDTKDEE